MKKVKFSNSPEFEAEYDKEIDVDEEDLENDLDLDTIKAHRRAKISEFSEDEDEGDDGTVDDAEVDDAEVDENQLAPSTPVVDWNDDLSETDIFDSESVPAEEIDDRQIQIEPFNTHADREAGTFDADGFYIRNVDEDAHQDGWMSNFTRSDIAKAREAFEQKQKLQASERVESPLAKLAISEIYSELIGLLEPKQGIADSIRSLSATADISSSETSRPRPPLNKNRLKKLAAEGKSSDDAASTLSTARKAKINRITELADELMNRGNFNIYEESFEQIRSHSK